MKAEVDATVNAVKIKSIVAGAPNDYDDGDLNVPLTITFQNDKTETREVSVSGTRAYNAGVSAGKSAVTVDTITQSPGTYNSSTKIRPVTITAKASNGATKEQTINVSCGDAYNDGWISGYNAAASKFKKDGWYIYGPAETSAANSSPTAYYKVSYSASQHSYTASTYKASSFNGPGSYIASSYTKETHSYTASSCSIGSKQS